MSKDDQIEYSERYEWDNPDLNLLKQIVEMSVNEVLNEVDRFNGSISNLGPPRRNRSFNDLKDWLTALSNTWDTAQCFVYSADSYNMIIIELDPKEFTFIVAADLNTSEKAENLFREIEHRFGLQPRKENKRRENQHSIRHMYFLPKPHTPEWLLKTISIFDEILSRKTYFGGSIYIANVEHNWESLDEWKNNVISQWEKITSLTFFQDDKNLAIYFQCNFDREEGNIKIDGATNEIINTLFERIEKHLDLIPLDDSENELEGLERTYFTSEPLREEWFTQVFNNLEKYTKAKIFFTGNFVLRGETDKHTTESFEQWSSDISRQWEKVTESYCHISTRQVKLTFRFDLIKEMITLEIQAKTSAQAEKILDEFKKSWNLIVITKNPYQRRSSREFSLLWESKKFTESIADITKIVCGSKYIVAEAYIEMWAKKNKIRNSYSNLDEFLQAIKEIDPDSKVEEIYIYIEGRLGKALSIELTNDLSHLAVRSSLDIKEFNEAIRVFNRLNIKEIKPTGEQPRKSNVTDSLWFKIALPVITALVTFILTPTFLRAPVPQYDIHIRSPRVVEGTRIISITAQEVPQEVPIEWDVNKEQWFISSTDRNAPANIRILQNGLSVVQELNNQEPGTKILLEPGTYDIEVYLVESGVSDKIRIVIEP